MAAAELPRCLAFNGIRVSELTRDAAGFWTTPVADKPKP